jgi:hypothetical protein
MNIRKWATTIAACSLFLFPTQTIAAASKDGNNLLTQCQLSNNLAVIACHIYIHAVLDVLVENSVNGYRVCVPENTDIDQSVHVIVEWLTQHTDERPQPASDVVAHALWETYPCT